MAELARRILELARRPVDDVATVPDRPFNDRRYLVEDEKLRALGWRPTVDFREGLADVFAETAGVDYVAAAGYDPSTIGAIS